MPTWLLTLLIGGASVAGGYAAGRFSLTLKHSKGSKELKGYPKREFGWVGRDLALALKRNDCEGAQASAYGLVKLAKTAKDQNAAFRAQRRVQRCYAARDL